MEELCPKSKLLLIMAITGALAPAAVKSFQEISQDLGQDQMLMLSTLENKQLSPMLCVATS